MNEILREKIAREVKRHKVARDPEDLFQSISHEMKNTWGGKRERGVMQSWTCKMIRGKRWYIYMYKLVLLQEKNGYIVLM